MRTEPHLIHTAILYLLRTVFSTIRRYFPGPGAIFPGCTAVSPAEKRCKPGRSTWQGMAPFSSTGWTNRCSTQAEEHSRAGWNSTHKKVHLARFHVDPLQVLMPVAESLEIMVG